MAFKIAGKEVGPIGVGMMKLAFPGSHPPTSEAVETLKAALNAGANVWNGGWFYGTPEYNSLHILNAYFTKYPEDADKVVISIKACMDIANAKVEVDEAGVKANIEKCLKVLDGKCRIDVFQPARLSPDVPVEETVGAIAEYVKAGKIGGIGLSECSAASIRKASKVHHIEAAEIELSLFSTEPLTNGVREACEENNVALVAYSPLGKGFLTGDLRKYEDLPKDDFRHFFPRFGKDVFDDNVKLVEEIEGIAKKKGCSVAQIAIAWVSALTKSNEAPIIPIPSVSSKARVGENLKQIQLSKEEFEELNEAIKRIEVKGSRAPVKYAKFLEV